MNPYMVHDGFPESGAVLVFARTAREARKVGFDFLSGWCDEVRWIYVRAKRLQPHPWLMADADPVKLAAGEPHGTDSPSSTCRNCGVWGLEPGTCCSRPERRAS